ncbi:MAG: hypothetical protein L0271_21390 [Gemmatimonadetes bacterium]|nr:hypothetical protein [Gemmatimonadota bacterium]
MKRWNSVAALAAMMMTASCAASSEPTVDPSPLVMGAGKLAVAYDDGTRELVLEMAPVDLPAGAGHDVRQPGPGEAALPIGGWLRGYRVELIDAQGRAVPREVIHHVNIMAPTRRELFSPVMQRIGAVGHETAPVVLPRVFGYPIEQGDRVLVSAMLHNPTSESYEGVRVRVRFLHADNGWLDPIAIQPFYMDVTPPATIHAFDLRVGRSATSWEATPAIDGRIMALGGHLHQHAVVLRLEDVTEGRILYEAEPVTDETGAVIGMPQDHFLFRRGLRVRAGHTYRLTAIYENDTGAAIPSGGMGALGGILVAARRQEWPGVDPNDPEYVKDYEIRTTSQTSVEMVGAPATRSHVHRP